MNQDSPNMVEAGPKAGLLRDLGNHVVDQIIYLIGSATGVDAQLGMANLPQAPTDVSFTIPLKNQEGGAHTYLFRAACPSTFHLPPANVARAAHLRVYT